MDVLVSPHGYVEVYDPNENRTHFQCFYNLKRVVKGDGFFVVQLKSGRVDVYDYKLALISYKVFDDIKKLKVNNEIIVTHKDGSREMFNKEFKALSA